MALAPGTRLGPYEITARIGAGGMGEVYRATDTDLGREVAVKVLPERFAQDAERLARFEREARTLAALNHPNIAIIHGLEKAGPIPALIIELVEGPTLAERIAQGPIPVDEALAIANQIIEALEAAHEQGIIHRDVKPANIKVRRDGAVKVMDFGLAKALEPNKVIGDLSQLSTVAPSTMMTRVGALLGTPAYMSPEQARGEEVRQTVDVWAFGCVLFEMLSGRPAFDGGTGADLFAAVLTAEPEWTSLPRSTPIAIRRLLRRCLQKDRKQRLQHIGDARIEIDDALRDPDVGIVAGQTVQARREPRLISALSVLALVALIAASAAMWALRLRSPELETRVDIATPPTTAPQSFELSPDGRSLVFVAMSNSVPMLWLRRLDSATARVLPGTQSALSPFFAPDGRAVGFFAEDKLKRADLETGGVQVLAEAHSPFSGGAWNTDGTILFTPEVGGRFATLSATDGKRVASLPYGGRAPSFLPDGNRFLYVSAGSKDAGGVYVGALDGAEPQRLLDGDRPIVHRPSGRLLFTRQGTLFAQPFIADRAELRGSPVALAENVSPTALFTAASGSIAYRHVSAGGQGRLVWFDRSGRRLADVGDVANPLISPAMSADAHRLAGHSTNGGRDSFDIWLLDLRRGVQSRLTTSAPGNEVNPIWSPDGLRVAYMSRTLPGVGDIYEKPIDGSSDERPLLVTGQNKTPVDWSSDGRFVLYQNTSASGGDEWGDVWALPLFGERKPFPVVETPARELNAQFSPDGKWIAYQSNESGRFEIYVQPFPGPGPRTLVSTNGGAQVRWRRDSKELFYVSLDGRLMAVPVSLPSDGGMADVGTPLPLFVAHFAGGPVQGPLPAQYVVEANGQRFLLLTVDSDTTPPITLILNLRTRP